MRFDEIKKGQKDSNGFTKCWPGKHAEGTKKGKNGGQVRNCVPNESVAEGKDEKIAQLKKDYATAVHWSKNDTNPHKREAARQKAEKIKAHLEKQYKQGVAEGSSSGYTYKDTDEGTYLTNTMGETLFIPDVSLQDQGFKPGDRRLPEVWQMNLEMADETGAYIVDDEQGVAENIRVEPVAQALRIQSTQTQPKQNVYVAPNKKTPAVVNHIKPQGVAEDYSAEYDDEAGMAQGSLHTLQNAVEGLQQVIDAGDNLPEWCQEKISLAEDYLVTVWDYIQSEKAQGIDPDISEELAEEFDLIESTIDKLAVQNGVDAEMIWEDLESLSHDELYVFAVTSEPIMESEAWQKANNKDKTDGMSSKAVKAYRREHPGSKLQTAVTTKPSKLKKGSKASKRRKSYCSRSRGQMNMHSISCAKTPDKAICKARRRWNC